MRWPTACLADLVEINIGKTPARAEQAFWDGDLPWLAISDMQDEKYLSSTKEGITAIAVNKTNMKAAKAGTLLFSFKLSIGKVGIAQNDLFHNEAIAALPIIDSKNLDVNYFYYAMKQLDAMANTDRAVMGATLNKKKLAEIEIPLPPLATQQHIARVLEQADRLRKQAQQMEREFNQLAQSLFLEMFGDLLRNPKKWPFQSLGALIVDGPKNGLYKHADDYGSGTPIIRIDNFYGGELTSPRGFKRVSVTDAELERFKVQESSLLINRVNSPEYLGKAALVENLQEPTVFESNMMNFSVDVNKVNPQFLVIQLGSQFVREQIRKSSKDAVNQSSINQGDVQSFLVALPPITEQEAFAKRLQEIRNVRTMCIGNKSVFDDLFNSLMQRAFNGELTAPERKAA